MSGLSTHGSFEAVAKRIVSQHSDDDWAFGRGKSRGRPVRELGEPEEEDRLQGIFLGGLGEGGIKTRTEESETKHADRVKTRRPKPLEASRRASRREGGAAWQPGQSCVERLIEDR